jgi:hypothetical protein
LSRSLAERHREIDSSQLESGNGNLSLETLWALSVALTSVWAAGPAEAARGSVIRAGEGPAVAGSGHHVATLLASCPPNARRDIYLI